MCGFMTILVLRGTIGAGNFGTPAQDFEEIKAHLRTATREYRAARNLAQVEERGLAERLPVVSIEDIEETRTDPAKPYSLGPAITDWDTQRQQWKVENPDTSANVKGKSRMLLVTGSQPSPCDNLEG